MRLGLLALGLMILQGSFEHEREVDASPERFSTQRVLAVPAGTSGQACAVLDGAVYAHTEGRMSGLRVYRVTGQAGQRETAVEVPFALTESGEAGQQEEAAGVLNLGTRGKAIVFDLAMPQRTYTAVTLGLEGRDFTAVAKVSGSDGRGGPATELGTFSLFDLRSQGLGRSTTLPLQEVDFAELHVELMVVPAAGHAGDFGPGMVTGAVVPPSREAQMLFTTVGTTTVVVAKGREQMATLQVAAHVPVERVRFEVANDFKKNFSREVRVTAYLVRKREGVLAVRDVNAEETETGEIQRVRMGALSAEQTSVEAMLGANLRSDAIVEVVVENGDDLPLPLTAVKLEMRQRKLCFDAEPLGDATAYVLRYGDSASVRAPVYDYARLFAASAAAAVVTMGPELRNPALNTVATVAPGKSYTERHPELLWVVLLAVICVLGMIAVRSAKVKSRG